MIHFYADPHFGDETIIKFCNRPFKSSIEMDRSLIQNFNMLVSPLDITVIAGDFSFSRSKDYIREIVSKMNGRKILVLGNHDYLHPNDYLEIGFWSVHTSYVMDQYQYIVVHDPAISAVDRKSTFICGHVHDLFKRIKNVINVSVDVWDYKPVSILQIENLNEEIRNESKDKC